MSRKMAWLALALVAMLVMLPLLATGNLWPELPPQADKPAALPQYLQPTNSRSLAVPPEPIPLPLAVQVAMKPFLLLLTAMSVRLRLRQPVMAMPRSFFPIDLCLLQSYRDHPYHAPPAYL